jgi:hypothetical protein
MKTQGSIAPADFGGWREKRIARRENSQKPIDSVRDWPLAVGDRLASRMLALKKVSQRLIPGENDRDEG